MLYNNVVISYVVFALPTLAAKADTNQPLPVRQREGNKLAEIRVGKNESLETALKRFKRSCAKDGVIAEVRKREHYEKPSVKRKKKSEAARKRKY